MLNNFSYVVKDELAGCAHPDSLGDCGEALAELRERGVRLRRGKRPPRRG